MSVFDGLGRLDSSFSPRSAASQDSCKAFKNALVSSLTVIALLGERRAG
jgi:hypothetical protein